MHKVTLPRPLPCSLHLHYPKFDYIFHTSYKTVCIILEQLWFCKHIINIPSFASTGSCTIWVKVEWFGFFCYSFRFAPSFQRCSLQQTCSYSFFNHLCTSLVCNNLLCTIFLCTSCLCTTLLCNRLVCATLLGRNLMIL